jgi:hypothetical protein
MFDPFQSRSQTLLVWPDTTNDVRCLLDIELEDAEARQ